MNRPRQSGVDALKVLASQAIVLHHLCSYGPVADAVESLLPGLVAWFYDYGRMAVQVFLVLGGYLAVQPLMQRTNGPVSGLLRAIGQRYLRLVPPFAIAMALAVAAAWWTRPWLTGELLDPQPRAGQLLAHLFLLHEVLDVGALSAGVWYVAIDFQLYSLMALLLWLGQRRPGSGLAMLLVLGLCAVSLLLWNAQPALDDWALYFFGAYGLGALARWSQDRPADGHGSLWLASLIAVAALALLVDFRTRVALALGVALLLAATHGQWPGLPARLARALARLGRSSYALFLVHFPVLLVGNAWWAGRGLSGHGAALAIFVAIWASSMLLAWAFERWIEAPLGQRLKAPRPASSLAPER